MENKNIIIHNHSISKINDSKSYEIEFESMFDVKMSNTLKTNNFLKNNLISFKNNKNINIQSNYNFVKYMKHLNNNQIKFFINNNQILLRNCTTTAKVYKKTINKLQKNINYLRYVAYSKFNEFKDNNIKTIDIENSIIDNLKYISSLIEFKNIKSVYNEIYYDLNIYNSLIDSFNLIVDVKSYLSSNDNICILKILKLINKFIDQENNYYEDNIDINTICIISDSLFIENVFKLMLNSFYLNECVLIIKNICLYSQTPISILSNTEISYYVYEVYNKYKTTKFDIIIKLFFFLLFDRNQGYEDLFKEVNDNYYNNHISYSNKSCISNAIYVINLTDFTSKLINKIISTFEDCIYKQNFSINALNISSYIQEASNFNTNEMTNVQNLLFNGISNLLNINFIVNNNNNNNNNNNSNNNLSNGDSSVDSIDLYDEINEINISNENDKNNNAITLYEINEKQKLNFYNKLEKNDMYFLCNNNFYKSFSMNWSLLNNNNYSNKEKELLIDKKYVVKKDNIFNRYKNIFNLLKDKKLRFKARELNDQFGIFILYNN